MTILAANGLQWLMRLLISCFIAIYFVKASWMMLCTVARSQTNMSAKQIDSQHKSCFPLKRLGQPSNLKNLLLD